MGKTDAMDVAEFCRRLPKVELHLHLEGAVDAATLADLAEHHGLELPPHDDPADLYTYDSLADFLQIYSLVCASIRTADDFRRVTAECLARCAQSGARYVELFFSPEAHLDHGVAYATMLEGIDQGRADAATEHGLACNVVPAINRELGPERALQFVEMVVAEPRPWVIGIGLDYNEDGHPPAPFAPAFQLAADNGLHRTSHAGEVGPAAHVAGSIDVLGCERVDHGYHIVDDADLLARCAASGIPFTACPTTTTYTTVFRDLSAPDHAIRRMADAGLNLTVNSDDPPMFGTDLATEYQLLHDQMGFRPDELARFALNGIGAAWVDEATKAGWQADWSAEVEQLLAQVGG